MDRLVAIIIDLIILRLLAQVLPFTILYHQILPDDFKNAVFETLSRGEKYLLAPAYFVGLRAWWNGQTLGKRVLGLRCVAANGEALKFWQAVVDCLGYLIWPIDFIVGALLSGHKNQRLTQMIAGTQVIKGP